MRETLGYLLIAFVVLALAAVLDAGTLAFLAVVACVGLTVRLAVQLLRS